VLTLRNVSTVYSEIIMYYVYLEIDIEKCVHDSIKIFCSTPKSATFRQHAKTQKHMTPRKPEHSYYTQDYHETPKTELVSILIVSLFYVAFITIICTWNVCMLCQNYDEHKNCGDVTALI